MGRVLAQAHVQKAYLLLVERDKTWYPLLLSMQVDFPCLIQQDPQEREHHATVTIDTQLFTWNISGLSTDAKTIHKTHALFLEKQNK